MKRSKLILIGLVVVLSVMLMMLSIYFVSYVSMSTQYKRELSNIYMKNMYNFVDDVADIEVGLSKLMATNNVDSQREILSDVYLSTTNASSSMSNLPIESVKTKNVSTLINTLGGYVYSLLTKTYEDKSIANDDYVQLESMHGRTKALLYDINEYLSTTKDKYDILKYVDFSSAENSEFNAGVHTNESSASKVPSLIYDGPFSDSVTHKEIKGLGSVEYSESDAYNLVKRVYSDSVIRYIGDSSGLLATYNYKVDGDNTLYVNVTKLGCMIISVVSYSDSGDIIYSVADGVKIAETFAKNMGIDNMYSVWTQGVDNTLYVNLAPIVDRVIYYPDLIKVKVDLSTGNVVGWEAKNYAYNHVDTRPKYKTTTSILDGDKYLNSRLKVLERNYAIIPNKYVGESYVYEYICEWGGYTYYVYLDINTFEEVNIMRVIDTTSGSLIE